MGKLITASIDVTKIDKAMLIKGKKGTYLNLSIWINDSPDQFGNDVSVQQKTEKDAPKIYLGNGKTYKQAGQSESEQKNDAPPSPGDDDNLPF